MNLSIEEYEQLMRIKNADKASFVKTNSIDNNTIYNSVSTSKDIRKELYNNRENIDNDEYDNLVKNNNDVKFDFLNKKHSNKNINNSGNTNIFNTNNEDSNVLSNCNASNTNMNKFTNYKNNNRRNSSFFFLDRNSSIEDQDKPNKEDNKANKKDDLINNQAFLQIDYNKELNKQQLAQIQQAISKTKDILSKLYSSSNYNNYLQQKIKLRSRELNHKQSLIEENISRIKKLLRPKQKKHVKYTQFTPLAKVYNYSIKKVPRYFQLLELVTSSTTNSNNKHYNDESKNDNYNDNYIYNDSNDYGESSNSNNFEEYNDEDFEISDSENNNTTKTVKTSKTSKKCKIGKNTRITRTPKTKKDNKSKKLASSLSIQDSSLKNNQKGSKQNNTSLTNYNNDCRVQTTINKDQNRFKFQKYEDRYLKDKDFLEINWKEISSLQLPNRSIFELFVRKLELNNFYQYKKWTPSEDFILKKAILYYGSKNWQQISYCLEGRNNSQCFHRWMKGINPKIKRSKWSFKEDLTLGLALKIYGDKKWAKICHHIPQRTDIQCRERYCNILDPKLIEINWSEEEDLKLIHLFSCYGNKWSLIAKSFGDRTDNTCWRRYKYLRYLTLSKNSNNNISKNTKLRIKAENTGNKDDEIDDDYDEEDENKYDDY